MSGSGIVLRCLGCGRTSGPFRQNKLIGGIYCVQCDDFITKPSPKLEARYNKRVAARKAKEGK